MKKSIILALLILSFSIDSIQAVITATQVGMLDFKVDQNLTAADMDGTNDVTTKLQAAVNNARYAYKSLFIPSGTYKISSTINCILDGDASPRKATNIIGSSLNHPLIKIADNTPFFNGLNPRAIFEYHSNNPSYDTGYVMEGGVRAVDFDLGSGNTNAVALYWGCAQYCYVEDININARDGFAGLTGLGGANCLFSNIAVTGGQYGIYLPNYTLGNTWTMGISAQNTITGCTFTNQTNIPVVLWGWGGITFVGVNIVTSTSIAIRMDCENSSAVNEFPFSMIDSKIEFTVPLTSNCAISNLKRGTVSLRGVYVKGAGTICSNNADENLISSGLLTQWTCVNRYNYIDKVARNDASGNLYSGLHYDAVTGSRYKTAVIDKINSDPPSGLISNHIWATTPSFEDADAVLVTSAAGLQSAINANTKKVCVAKGTYSLTAPLSLKAGTILFGCPGRGACGTILTYGWTPSSPEWLINTVDDAAATTYLMDITTDPGNINYEGSLHWMAGANSIIRDVWFDKSWDTNEKDIIRLYFSGNGGGRVFNYQDEKSFSGNVSSNSLNYRKVKISGTSQQLTFYGLNLERGGAYNGTQSSFPLVEMTNSSNIRIFGAKTETYQPYAKISNCSNIFLTNVIDLSNLNSGLTAENYIEIDGTGSNNIEIANSMFLRPPDSTYMIVKDPWNTNVPKRNMHLGLYHRKSVTLVTNPTFDSNTTGWSVELHNGASASVASVYQTWYTGNACKINIANIGTGHSGYEIQLKQVMPIVAGHTYTVKFKASAIANRTLGIVFQQSGSPYTNYWSNQSINITTTPTTFGPYTFVCSTTDATENFRFWLGGDTTAVWIDDVEITDSTFPALISTNSKKIEIEQALMVYPNPTTDYINIDFSENIGREHAKITLVDISGKIVFKTEVSQVSSSHLVTSQLAKGMYFISVVKGSEEFTKKIIIQ